MAKKQFNGLHNKHINIHLAFIIITLIGAVAVGLIQLQAQRYTQALVVHDTAVLGAMTNR